MTNRGRSRQSRSGKSRNEKAADPARRATSRPLTIGATKPGLIDRHRRTHGAYTRADLNLLLGCRPRFEFCEQAAAEASNMVDQHGEPQRSRTMAVLKPLLNSATEVAVACRAAMDQLEYLLLGLAGAAQLALCGADTVPLTDDAPVFRAATTRGLDALLFSQERRHRIGEA